ncbi:MULTISPECIES: four helix bundle protein [unclassified Flavobacterium]|uniref:four helix bundle protein n=1 Tax=unclassified Flavobacterium TaxID=196869 RepID=UPI001F12BEFD|nr:MULTISPECIES: four helix bundle protein [unclassified Flavobacterium]UMY64768.1 four helix bundle protein [Flavobacterium sp. HJ-32-4]
MSAHKKLIIWQKGVTLAVDVYSATQSLPIEERYGLLSQIRRSASSFPANIAEGYGRGRKNELGHFLRIARGSLFELQTHLEIAHRVGYLDLRAHDDLFTKTQELDAMLSAYMSKLLQ